MGAVAPATTRTPVRARSTPAWEGLEHAKVRPGSEVGVVRRPLRIEERPQVGLVPAFIRTPASPSSSTRPPKAPAPRALRSPVLNGVVGAAGLMPSVRVLERGKTLALANKESLVVGGECISALLDMGRRVVPVDSEHSAILQCLAGQERGAVESIILTASGGPFRKAPGAEFAAITPQQALAHPTWYMGPKITIDSATLMNKGLEVIEAHHLFGVAYERIGCSSIPRASSTRWCEFDDGAIIAQLGRARHARADRLRARLPGRAPHAAHGPPPRLPRRRPHVRRSRRRALPRRSFELAVEAGKRQTIALSSRPAASAGCACRRPPPRAGPPPRVPPRLLRTVAAPIVLNAANEVAVHAFSTGVSRSPP